MKNPLKLITIILSSVIALSTAGTVVSIATSYTKDETDVLISELQTNVDKNKSDLQALISALQSEYEVKNTQLLQAIEQNTLAISALKSEYEGALAELKAADKENKDAISDLEQEYLAKVEELVASDSANAQALANLKTEYESKVNELKAADQATNDALNDLEQEYLAKVEELQVAIDDANQTIASNKTALENAINSLKGTYESKIAEIEGVIESLKTQNANNAQIITELTNRIVELEKGLNVTAVQFADNGDLVLTFADGSSQTIECPKQHEHSFGEWIVYTTDSVPCEQRLFYHICSTCRTVEIKQGSYENHSWSVVTTAPTCQAQGYDTKTCSICSKVETVNFTPIIDHPWNDTYSYNTTFHWYACATCDSTKDYAEHTALDTDVCSVCGGLVGPTIGVEYDLSADGTYAEVIGYTGTAVNVRIAEEYQGKPVTNIYDFAFNNKYTIKSIILPDGLLSIGNSAFHGCRGLTSIEIPDSVTSIGNYAFSDCSSLTSIEIPDSVTSIGERSFSSCSSLTEVNYLGTIDKWAEIEFANLDSNPVCYAESLKINGEVVTEAQLTTATKISNYAFYNFSSLTSVEIPESVTSIGDEAFYNCSSLTSVEIPESVTSIGVYSFSGCSSLQFNVYNNAKYLGNLANPYHALIEGPNSNISSISVHADAKIIAGRVFSGYSRLASVEIPDSVTYIGDYAFYRCSSLTSLEIPNSVTSIGNFAFEYCSSLTSVVIGNSVTYVSWAAFSECSNLTSVVIGDSVTTIGNYAFSRCSSLTKVYYKGNSTEWGNITIGSFSSDLTNATRYYYSESEPMVSGKFWHYDENGAIVEW